MSLDKIYALAADSYIKGDWQILPEDLLVLAREGVAVSGLASPYGLKYVVVGRLTGSNGRVAFFTTVWIVKPGEPAPHFVTAFPE